MNTELLRDPFNGLVIYQSDINHYSSNGIFQNNFDINQLNNKNKNKISFLNSFKIDNSIDIKKDIITNKHLSPMKNNLSPITKQLRKEISHIHAANDKQILVKTMRNMLSISNRNEKLQCNVWEKLHLSTHYFYDPIPYYKKDIKLYNQFMNEMSVISAYTNDMFIDIKNDSSVFMTDNNISSSKQNNYPLNYLTLRCLFDNNKNYLKIQEKIKHKKVSLMILYIYFCYIYIYVYE